MTAIPPMMRDRSSIDSSARPNPGAFKVRRHLGSEQVTRPEAGAR